jgi:hypothetical protein
MLCVRGTGIFLIIFNYILGVLYEVQKIWRLVRPSVCQIFIKFGVEILYENSW